MPAAEQAVCQEMKLPVMRWCGHSAASAAMQLRLTSDEISEDGALAMLRRSARFRRSAFRRMCCSTCENNKETLTDVCKHNVSVHRSDARPSCCPCPCDADNRQI